MTTEVSATRNSMFIYEVDYEHGYRNVWLRAVFVVRKNGEMYDLLLRDVMKKGKRVEKVKSFKELNTARKEMAVVAFAYAV